MNPGRKECGNSGFEGIASNDAVVEERRRLLVEEVETRFPWTENTIRRLWDGIGGEPGDILGGALQDILEDRLTPADLHSGVESSDWTLVEGLASFLKSGTLYKKYNAGLPPSLPQESDTRRKIHRFP